MMEKSTAPRARQPLSLGSKIIIGVAAGIACGIFLGELSAPLKLIGRIYVGLLQMTVLPYVTVSLISKIGSLTLDSAKRLAGRAGLVLLAFWVISLLTVVVMPLSLPAWEAGTFFSASLVSSPDAFDFIDLYLPTNPFHSLANNVVPAAVLFSILMGVALISIKGKSKLLDPLKVMGNALSEISNFIVRLSPWGTFALAAGAAGTLSPADLARLMGYVGSFTFAVILLTFVVFPALVAAVTPYRYREMLRGSRDAVLMAFATGKLFAVLPMISDSAKNLLVSRDVPEEEARATADMLVPLAYPFPNAGKILGLLFIPFAAWYVNHPLELTDYPMLLVVGLLAFFGSPVAAIPFLLGMLRLPADLFPLFLVAGIWCARLGDVLGAVHLTSFAVITSAWNRGWMRLNPARLGVWLIVAVVSTGIAMLLNHLVVRESLAGQEPSLSLVAGMELQQKLIGLEVAERAAPNPVPLEDDEGYLARIRRTGVLRVGFVPDNPPFSYQNSAGELVGFDVDLIQHLAADLDVSLVLVPVVRADLGQAFQADHFDLAVGEIPSSIHNLEFFEESEAYLELHAALVVRDHRVKEFKTLKAIRRAGGFRIACVEGGLLVKTGRSNVPGLEVVLIPNEEVFLADASGRLDALLTTAESGSVLSMIHPEFSMIVPEGVHVRVPVVIAVQESTELHRLVNTWVNLMRRNGTVDALYEHWILGGAAAKQTPRWSVVRNVFGWVK